MFNQNIINDLALKYGEIMKTTIKEISKKIIAVVIAIILTILIFLAIGVIGLLLQKYPVILVGGVVVIMVILFLVAIIIGIYHEVYDRLFD